MLPADTNPGVAAAALSCASRTVLQPADSNRWIFDTASMMNRVRDRPDFKLVKRISGLIDQKDTVMLQASLTVLSSSDTVGVNIILLADGRPMLPAEK